MAATQRVLAEKSTAGLVLGWKRGISSPVLQRAVWNDVGVEGKPDQFIHSRLKTGSHSGQATCQGFTTHLWGPTLMEMDAKKKNNLFQPPDLFCIGLGKHYFNSKKKREKSLSNKTQVVPSLVAAFTHTTLWQGPGLIRKI